MSPTTRELTNTLADLQWMDIEDHPLFGDMGFFRRLRPADYKDHSKQIRDWLSKGISYLIPNRYNLLVLLNQLRRENMGFEQVTFSYQMNGETNTQVDTYICFHDYDRFRRPEGCWGRPLSFGMEGKRRFVLRLLNDEWTKLLVSDEEVERQRMAFLPSPEKTAEQEYANRIWNECERDW